MSNEHHELAIIGAGPAGMSAAVTAASVGLDSVLLDEQAVPGGQIYRNIEALDRGGTIGILGDDYRRGVDLVQELRASSCDYQALSTVWQASADGRVGVTSSMGARMIRVERVLIATGAQERPVPVPGWTKRGVMTVGAAQTLLKASQLVPDVPIVMAGSGPLIYLVAVQLARAGCTIAAILITTPGGRITSVLKELPRALLSGRSLMKGIGWINEVRRLGIPTTSGVSQLQIEGREQAEAVSYKADGRRQRVAAGLVLLHEGIIPNVQLSLAARCRHIWDESQLCWRPDTDEWGATSHDRIAVIGDGAGIHGAQAAEPLGRLAALDTAFRLGRIDRATRDRQARTECRELARHDRIRPLLDRLFQPMPGMLLPEDPETIVCRCEDVTLGALRDAVKLGANDPNRAKLLTRCGMGPCQGRMCGPTVAQVIAHETEISVQAAGTYRIRVPVRPVPLATLAELAGTDEGLPAAEATL